MNAGRKRKKQIRTVETIPVVSSPIYLALCFVFPFVIMGTVFALHGVYPFGGKQILIYDFWHQHYPFLSSLWHKLRDGLPGSPSLLGSVSPWSWTAGGGHDYAALTAYYMASPLNLFALMLPHAWLREALTVILLVRIGCAGLFTGIFLRGAFWQDKHALQGGWPGNARHAWHVGLALPFFSSLYALCAFTLGYYWTIIWFDTFALLPLVALGVLRLVNDGKYRLYIVSLALSVLANFYMGIFICIFAALAFFGLCFIQKLNPRDFFGKLGLIAGCSALALGMAAAVIIPSWSALQNTYGAGTAFPAKPALYTSFFNILGNFIAFTPPTIKEGLPSLYCGMISVLLAGLYLYSAKVSRREKIVFAGTVVFLLISCNLNMLDYIMHGFRYPIQLPSRFSFLISFILVAAAYRAFLLTENINRRGLLAMGTSAAVFLLAAAFGSQEKKYIIGSVVLCAFYLLVFYIFTGTRTVRHPYGTARHSARITKGQAILQIVFFVAVLTELSITSWIAVKTAPLSNRDKYPDNYEQMQALLAMRPPTGSPSGEPDGIDFYRTDIDNFFTFNDPSLYNYNGISFFSSTANVNVSRFMVGLGLPGFIHTNHYWYDETSPLAGAFLNMRYMIRYRGNPADNSVYWKTAGEADDSLLLENRYYLPLGFMVNEDVSGYVYHSNPFLSQNDLFRRTTGLDEDLFTMTDISALAIKDQGITIWDYEMPSDGTFYAHCKSDKDYTVFVFINGVLTRYANIPQSVSHFHYVGSFSQGDIISFSSEESGISIITGYLNSDLFEQGYALLADETLHLTKFTDTEVSGQVTALKDGVLYTSIPGDKNWNVFVDGVKSEIVLIDNAMAAVRLKEGTHTVEFRYFNKSLLAGIIVSLVSLAVFAALVLVQNRRPCRHAGQGKEEK